MAKKESPELSITASVAIILIGAACVLLMMSCKKNTAKPAVGNPELKRSMDELSRKLKDPRVSQCFQAAFAMGKSMRQQGSIRPSDAQLHELGLQACNYFKVPQDMRGVAVDKFKNGFGWGWSAGP
jgi:hypothetical protein